MARLSFCILQLLMYTCETCYILNRLYFYGTCTSPASEQSLLYFGIRQHGGHTCQLIFLENFRRYSSSSNPLLSQLDDSKLTSLPPSMPTPVALFDQLSDSLARLESRVRALEQSRPPASTPSDPHSPPRSTDPFSNHMIVLATAAGFTRTLFTRCPPDYYEWPLERRRRLLNAVSLHHLTKSIVLENTRHSGPHDENADVVAARYICCVVPYTAKINSDLLRDAVRRDGMKRGVKVPGVRGMNWRLAGDCNGVTGYEPNAVTPLGIRTRMPVVVAKQVAQLEPGEFWLGGGAVSLKWRVEWEEFRKVFSPIVLDFAEVEEGY